MMYNPKTEVYATLSEIKGITLTQGSQAVFNELPAVTFSVAGNSVNVDMDNEITNQNINVDVHIWANSSVEASGILAQVEAKMRSIYYNLTSEVDVPNPDTSLFHIACGFAATKAINNTRS